MSLKPPRVVVSGVAGTTAARYQDRAGAPPASHTDALRGVTGLASAPGPTPAPTPPTPSPPSSAHPPLPPPSGRPRPRKSAKGRTREEGVSRRPPRTPGVRGVRDGGVPRAVGCAPGSGGAVGREVPRRGRDPAPGIRPPRRGFGRAGPAAPHPDVRDRGEIAYNERVGPARPGGRRPAARVPPRWREGPRHRGRPCDVRGGRGWWCVRAGTRGPGRRCRTAVPATARFPGRRLRTGRCGRTLKLEGPAVRLFLIHRDSTRTNPYGYRGGRACTGAGRRVSGASRGGRRAGDGPSGSRP